MRKKIKPGQIWVTDWGNHRYILILEITERQTKFPGGFTRKKWKLPYVKYYDIIEMCVKDGLTDELINDTPGYKIIVDI